MTAMWPFRKRQSKPTEPTMTRAAADVIALYWAHDYRWKYAATELTEPDIMSAPPHILPGLKYIVDRAKAENPYVWLDPWEGRWA